MLSYTCRSRTTELDVCVLAHHNSATYVHYLTPPPAGLRAEPRVGETVSGTDDSWWCLDLRMWKVDVPARGWALDYCEDYDARNEPEGWSQMLFPSRLM